MLEHEVQDRLALLSEAAQIQRRNVELAMNLYAWPENAEGKGPKGPMLSEGLRALCLKQIEASLLNLEKINEDLFRMI
jgi:hypothetical protein